MGLEGGVSMEAPLVYFNFRVEQKNLTRKEKPNEYACLICSCSLGSEQTLKQHVLRSHLNRAYIAPRDRTAFSITADGHHTRKLSREMMFSCNPCAKLYFDHHELALHIKAAHNVSIGPPKIAGDIIIKCPHCQAEYSNMRSLSCHMRYHKIASWTSTRRNSSLTQKPISANSTAHNPSIPSTKSTSGKTSTSLSPAKKSGKAATAKSDTAAATSSTNLATPSCGEDDTKGRRLRRRTCVQTQSSLFICTICRKTFHSYGNMMRHRRLSHESVIKKRPEFPHIRRRRRQRSRFCDPNIARRYYNKVASNIAFNVKNCIHGNLEHINVCDRYIRRECTTDLSQLRPNTLSKKTLRLCNIKTKTAKSLWKSDTKLKGISSTTHSRGQGAEAQSCTMKQFSLESKSPDVYDKPGLWKYLCLVCLQYFPNTLELFQHQDNDHKRISVAYMEVGKNYELPLRAVATSQPTGCIPVTDARSIVCSPTKFTCTKCQQLFKSREELYPHLVLCGKDLLKTLTVQIPPPVNGYDNGDRDGRWQRADDSENVQKKITDMNGFNVRKKKMSRLELEAAEQQRMEEKMRQIDSLSPSSFQPSLEPLVTLTDLTDYSQPALPLPAVTGEPHRLIYACPFCSIHFKYKKVYYRHIENKCEMMKRIASPGSAESDDDIALIDIIGEGKNSSSDPAKSTRAFRSADPAVKNVKETDHEKPANKQSTERAKQSADQEKPSTEQEINADVNEKSNTSTALISDEFFSPQKSLAQARVLAKFIHPARTCGPCFNCKKPNKARRYSHLQQRSEAYVRFVMSKCRNISLQSCICKACELRFKNDYDKRKVRLEKYSANRKAPSRTRSGASKGVPDSDPPLADVTTVKQKPFGKGKKVDKKRVDDNTKVKTLAVSHKAKGYSQFAASSQAKARKDKSKRVTAAMKKKLIKPVQIKSLEQIFPDASEEARDTLPNEGKPSQNNLESSNSDNRHTHSSSDIIDVEREMTLVPESVANSPTVTRQRPERRSPRRQGSDSIALRPGVFSGQKGNEARLKVILGFVDDAPVAARFKAGNRSSLSDIIDAVTMKVREDPALAKTITEAINSATSGYGAKRDVSPSSSIYGISKQGDQSCSDCAVIEDEVLIHPVSCTPHTDSHHFTAIKPGEPYIRRHQPTERTNHMPTSLIPTRPMSAHITLTCPTPVSSAPIKSTAVNFSSTCPTVVNSAPIRSTPVSSAPIRSIPVSSAPIRSTYASSAPIRSTPVSSAPIRSTAVSSAPIRSTAVSSAPIRSIPSNFGPIRSTSCGSSPVGPTPLNSRPICHKLLHSGPAHPAPGHPAPNRPGSTALSDNGSPLHPSNGSDMTLAKNKFLVLDKANGIDSACSTPSIEATVHGGIAANSVCVASSGDTRAAHPSSFSDTRHSVHGIVQQHNGAKDVAARLAEPSESVRAGKRAGSDIASQNTHCPPRKKFVMTASSFKHMVDIIDGVACGDIVSAASEASVDEDDCRSLTSSMDTNGSRYSYDFMVDTRDNLDCLRTADHTSGGPQPIKNLRLANIINKLSSSNVKDEVSRAHCPAPSPATSPAGSQTGSQNPTSIDSGFSSIMD